MNLSSTLEKAKQELNLQGKWAKQYDGWEEQDYWDMIAVYPLLTEDFIARYENNLNWNLISCYQGNLSESFIRQYQNEYDWLYGLIHQPVSESFIREFSGKVIWRWIIPYQVLSENFIKEILDKLDWEFISSHQILSENFIRENSYRVDWDKISSCQNISESFIETFEKEIIWCNLLRSKELSENFIRKHKEHFYNYYDGYKNLVKTQKISLSLARELGEEETFLKYNTSLVSPTEWKQIIADTKVFECFDDYFYAYIPISNIYRSQYSNVDFVEGKIINKFTGYERGQSGGVQFTSRQEAFNECDINIFDIHDSKCDRNEINNRNTKIRNNNVAPFIRGSYYSASMKIAKVKINYEDVTKVNKKGSPHQAWYGKELRTFYYDHDEIYCKKFKVEKIEDIKSEVVNI